MMKTKRRIGILTFHFFDNYGAVLQAWALRKTINSLGPYEATIVNYVPKDFKYRLYSDAEDALEKLTEKRIKFEKFLRNHCGVDTKMTDTVCDREYDVLCVGSDQIWNTTWNWVSEYFLPDIKETKKIAYAASLGINSKSVYWNEKMLRQYLPSFSAISLREDCMLNEIEKITQKKCQCVLDPTLLLDKKDYEVFLKSDSVYEKPYIFLFWIKHDFEYLRGIEFANRLARITGMGIVHAFADAPEQMIINNQGTMIYGGVEDFLTCIKNAGYVVTNSYHAALFSIQFEKNLYIFNVKTMSDRIDSLRSVFDLENNIIENVEDWIDIKLDNAVKMNTSMFLAKKEESIEFITKGLSQCE